MEAKEITEVKTIINSSFKRYGLVSARVETSKGTNKEGKKTKYLIAEFGDSDLDPLLRDQSKNVNLQIMAAYAKTDEEVDKYFEEWKAAIGSDREFLIGEYEVGMFEPYYRLDRTTKMPIVERSAKDPNKKVRKVYQSITIYAFCNKDGDPLRANRVVKSAEGIMANSQWVITVAKYKEMAAKKKEAEEAAKKAALEEDSEDDNSLVIDANEEPFEP